MIRAPAAVFEATYISGITGLVGTVEVGIHDNQGAFVFGPTAAGIVEIGDTGIYSVVLTAPAIEADYSIVWSDSGDFEADESFSEDLTVAASIFGLSPLPPLTDFGAGMGPPCSAWTTRAGVASCCDGFADATTDDQDAAIRAATEILYEVAPFSGECGPVTVRPCNQACGCWGPWSYGLNYSWDTTRGRWVCDTHACGCSPVSEVILAGVPIRTMLEVLIDGVALDTDEWGLIEPNVLVRSRDVDDPKRRLSWPGCQIMDLPETEEGTFAITYTHGADPPQAGRSAAAVLACAIWRSCPDTDGECVLPEAVTRVERQGITFELGDLSASAIKNGTTGISAVDAFVGLFGHSGPRSSVWSPDLDYPRRYRDATGT